MSGRRFGSRRADKRALVSRVLPKLEFLESRQLLAIFSVTNTQDLFPNGATVPNSLRDAIERSNLLGGADTIQFNIAGGGVHTIRPTRALPPINDALTIDGTTQAQYSSNPLIEIDGSSALLPAGTHGLRLSAGNVVVKALAISNFSGSGIRVEADATSIQLCFIGTSATGDVAQPNGDYGIYVDGRSNTVIGGVSPTSGATLGNLIAGNARGGIFLFAASNNRVLGNAIGTDLAGGRANLGNAGNGVFAQGGSFNVIGDGTPGSANVISGNSSNGVSLLGTRNTSILGNFIGTDGQAGGSTGGNPTGGTQVLANGGAGIALQGAAGTFIGGTSPGSGNLISGNTGAGISILGGTATQNGRNTRILGNFIGADSTGAGSSNFGNVGAGISINGGDATEIGGTVSGAANVIANNGRSTGLGGPKGGINIFAGRQIPILNNSIFNNFGPGIVLENFGSVQPVPNDAGDADTGPNDLQNYPVITTAGTAAGRTLIQGTFNSLPNATYRIQFFSNAPPVAGGLAQGQIFLGQTIVRTDSNGDAVINLTLNTPSTIGQILTATATDALDNTSEFSAGVPIVQARQASLGLTVTGAPSTATIGSDLTYTLTVINGGPDPATGVTLTQSLPVGVPFKSASAVLVAADGSETPLPASVITTNPAGSVVLGNFGTLQPGQAVRVTVLATPQAIGQVTTTATASSGEIDPDFSDNTNITATNTVVVPADLGVRFLPTTATVGQKFSVVVIAGNFVDPGINTGASTNTVVEIILPNGVSFDTASSGQGSTSFTTRTVGGVLQKVVTAQLGTLARGAAIPIRINLTAPITSPPAGLDLTASIFANETEPTRPAGVADPNANTATLNVPVMPSSDVSLRFAANPEPVLTGSNLTYNYTVTNAGPSVATGVVLTDTLPAGLDFVSASQPSRGTVNFDPTTRTLTVTIGTLDPLSSASATGSFVVAVSGPSRLASNTARVTLDQPDPVADNAVTLISTVSPADLSVRAEATPSPVRAGDNLTYTVLVTNNGPADALAVDVRDVLPAGVTFVSASANQGSVTQANGVVTANLGTIPFGATVPITIVVTPQVSAVLTNVATVLPSATGQVYINTGDDSQTTTTLVSPADLALTLSASPVTALAGDTITYTVVVRNNGPFAASNVLLSDTLSPGLQFLSATTTQGTFTITGGAVAFQLGSLASGGTATIAILARAVTDGSFLNTATVQGDQIDPNVANNTAQVGSQVTNGPGILGFSSSVFTTGENAGQAVITVTRRSGNRGQVTVNYTTDNGSAVAGSNYTPVSGTLTFLDGETSKTFSVPLIDDGVVNGDTTIRLTLSTPTGGATLGTDSSATLVVKESDFDVVGPQIAEIQSIGGGSRSFRGITIVFDEPLDPASAVNPANYRITAPGRDGKRVAINTPTYDPATNSVTITAAEPLRLNTFYQVFVNSNGIRDVFGNPLQGDGTGANGRDFLGTFARGSALRYVDQDGDLVTLNLSNRGVLDLTRFANGDGGILRVVGPKSRRSVLSGNVRRGSAQSDGVAFFQTIVDGGFGRVTSRLRTPRFFTDEVSAFIHGTGPAPVRTASVRVDSSATPGRLFARSFSHRQGK